jgi:hypothetical protein
MGGPELQLYLRRRVVLDTQGPMIYIGTLTALSEHGYWLADADVHDRSDGHSPKEVYISQARDLEKSGTRRTNRRLVHVERAAIISISALDDVVDVDGSGESDEGDGLA